MFSARDSLAGVCCLVSSMLVTVVAQAQPADANSSRAGQLFDEGKALLQQEQVDPACDKLEESQKLEPAVGTLGLLAYCRELQGHTATAWRRYLETADMAHATNDVERERVAKERAAELEGKLSRVRIAVERAVPGLVVALDDRSIPQGQWERGEPMDAGSIDVKATAPGFQSWTVRIELSDGSTIAIRVPALQPSAARTPTRPHDTQPNLIPGLAVGGAGVVLLGVGSYFGLRAMSKNDDSEGHCVNNACDREGGALRDDAKTAATISTVTVGLGLVGVGIGAVMLTGAMGGDREELHAMRVAPDLGPGRAGVAMQGFF